MKIAIIGRTQLLHAAVLELISRGHEITAIITSKAAPEYTIKEEDFRVLARQLDVPFFQTNNLDKPEVMAALEGSDIGVGVNWISIIRQKHIDLFKFGILNAHLGDLPKYRGNACPNWAIIKNESSICVSVHFVEGSKLDCGRILMQEFFPLDANSTIADVYKWASLTIPSILSDAVDRLVSDPSYILKYADQDAAESFRCWPRIPEDGFIDWNDSVYSIDRLIRASGEPFAGAYCYSRIGGVIKKVIVHSARIVAAGSNDVGVPGQVMLNDSTSGESHVFCGQGGGILALGSCRYEGEGNRFRPGDVWKTIRMRLQVRPEDMLWDLVTKKS